MLLAWIKHIVTVLIIHNLLLKQRRPNYVSFVIFWDTVLSQFKRRFIDKEYCHVCSLPVNTSIISIIKVSIFDIFGRYINNSKWTRWCTSLQFCYFVFLFVSQSNYLCWSFTFLLGIRNIKNKRENEVYWDNREIFIFKMSAIQLRLPKWNPLEPLFFELFNFIR